MRWQEWCCHRFPVARTTRSLRAHEAVRHGGPDGANWRIRFFARWLIAHRLSGSAFEALDRPSCLWQKAGGLIWSRRLRPRRIQVQREVLSPGDGDDRDWDGTEGFYPREVLHEIAWIRKQAARRTC